MRVTSRTGSRERQVLTGMIVDRTILARIVPKWDGKLFASDWSNIVGKWCVDFFKKFGIAPGKEIEGIFEQWEETCKDKESVALVDGFISSLSKEYELAKENLNRDLILDYAGELFTKVRARRQAEEALELLDNGDVTKAVDLLQRPQKVDVGVGNYIDVFQDVEAIRKAFEQVNDPVITYPGPAGQFFGNALERDALVAFLAPEKRGKTFWLLDAAYRAMLQRKRVAFFEVGDMTEAQIMRRFMTRAAKRPLGARTIQYPKVLKSAEDKSGKPEILLEERHYDKPLDWKIAKEACDKVMQQDVKSKKSYFRLSVHPNNSITALGIKTIVDDWANDGFNPDVIVIDYADLLAPINGTAETRDQINATWKSLRALSQINHCLVLTATQANAASYSADIIDMSNFSEDKRKFAHVTGMIGINQTYEEKKNGIQRLNWIVRREEESYDKDCLYVAGCLALANTCIRSAF